MLWYDAAMMEVSRWVRAALVAVALLSGCREAVDGRAPSYEGAVVVDVGQIRFDDGDTFMLGDEVIRLLGVDTPETKSPSVGIYIDQPFGPEAAESTRVWILGAERVEIVRDGPDTYGRRLAHIFVDGELLAVRLIESGLAYETVSHFGDNGFPDLADRILDAAEDAPRPQFQQPYLWRRKNQKRAH